MKRKLATNSHFYGKHQLAILQLVNIYYRLLYFTS